jgi:hypothetical protein
MVFEVQIYNNIDAREGNYSVSIFNFPVSELLRDATNA